jgi:thioredoxin reductase (NADPH)
MPRREKKKQYPAKALFVYIGAKPGTSWLNNLVMKNDKGFILTGTELMKEKNFHSVWKQSRELICAKQVHPESLQRVT